MVKENDFNIIHEDKKPEKKQDISRVYQERFDELAKELQKYRNDPDFKENIRGIKQQLENSGIENVSSKNIVEMITNNLIEETGIKIPRKAKPATYDDNYSNEQLQLKLAVMRFLSKGKKDNTDVEITTEIESKGKPAVPKEPDRNNEENINRKVKKHFPSGAAQIEHSHPEFRKDEEDD